MPSQPQQLTCNSRVNPRGIDSVKPEFAWITSLVQDAYEIEISTKGNRIWESGVVQSSKPYGACYGGPKLSSATVYTWRVRVYGSGEVSEWSEHSTFETGLLSPDDWTAKWITEAPRNKKSEPRTQYFQHHFELDKEVLSARAYVSALGWYHLTINDVNQTGHDLVPRFTPLDDVVEYQVYDVGSVLTKGENSIDVVVSEGRFRGALGTFQKTAVYGDRLATIVQIEVEFVDGSTRTICSDSSWMVGLGRIQISDPKKGERVDFRLPALPEEYVPVHLLPPHPRTLIAEEVNRVTKVGSFLATLSHTPSGLQLLDFGQNFNGVASVKLSGPAGTKVTICYSEVLTPDGELEMDYIEYASSNDWFQRDEVILGDEPIQYTPSFTIRGFRYVTVEGATITTEDALGIELSTPLTVTAGFHSSDPRLDKMVSTSMAALRANFSDTATDCPTRERTGWTGDIQVFAPTASIMVGVDGFLRRYLRNLALEQEADGRIPNWIPAEESDFSRGPRERVLSFIKSSVGWGDAAVLVPWTLYEYFGDEEVLRQQWPSALAWVNQLERRARRSGLSRRFGPRIGSLEKFIIDTGYHYGEWLRPGETPSTTFSQNVRRPPAEIATAYFALSAEKLSSIARVIGKHEEEEKWANVSAKTKEAWRAAFVRDGGSRIAQDRQDDYVRALEFGLLLPEQVTVAANRLAELVAQAGNHLATGFLSTPLLLQALSNNGHSETAYRVLLQETSPSWMGQLNRGATTWWETWEGYEENGKAKASHNHYAFGSVSRWLYEHVAGLRPTAPGYSSFMVAPVIGGQLTSASCFVDTRFGRASSNWVLDNGTVTLEVVVPAGTEAEVHAGQKISQVGEGLYSFTWELGDS